MALPKLALHSEVKYLKGVGPARAEIFASRSIRTVEDLLYYTPFRYEDRKLLARVRDLLPGQMATVLVKVISCGLMRTRKGAYLYDLAAHDASAEAPGGLIRCKWFNAVYLERNKTFRQGQRVFFYGKVEQDHYGTGNLVMMQPKFEIVPEAGDHESDSLEVGRITPIYEAIGNLSPAVLRRLMWNALALTGGGVPECLPSSILNRNKLAARPAALRETHFPSANQPLEKLARFRAPGQVRLIFEEFFNVGVAMALKRKQVKWLPGVQVCITEQVRTAVKRVLPFHPTAAQKRVLKEIVEDMTSPHPMSRLLQGDVGSGKTIVALQAAIVAVENGYQVALMAPTEILATQHYLYCKQLLAPLPYRIELLIGGRTAKEKQAVKKDLAEGSVRLVVGTHALIEPDVDFKNLALIIVDEQHRFGVMQRYELTRKGRAPHVLVMTATPIPRTCALAAYGDLDFSVIDEMPPHRTPITTRVFAERDRAEAFEFIRRKVQRGEQAYVVYPLIEESKKLDLRPAVQMYEHLSRTVFPELRVGLLHGRLPGEEKEAVMRRFRAGEIQILVSTTVVEVGVDVPNATVMLIEHAEHFGLAQLHQLRGRIGRGAGKSYCLLVAGDPRSELADERLRILTETNDGFKIADMDLKIRGPGEFLGTRQWGIPAFRIANLLRDQEVLEWAKREAAEFVERPESPEELAAFTRTLGSRWPERYRLARVG
ncbi:MAG TPA: ATP-dependent DNA helicase RecG [Terriglobia bacterium]|nr:ATP-dependent DNA helicase RecG [Terriglobia bacterium]